MMTKNAKRMTNKNHRCFQCFHGEYEGFFQVEWKLFMSEESLAAYIWKGKENYLNF